MKDSSFDTEEPNLPRNVQRVLDEGLGRSSHRPRVVAAQDVKAVAERIMELEAERDQAWARVSEKAGQINALVARLEREERRRDYWQKLAKAHMGHTDSLAAERDKYRDALGTCDNELNRLTGEMQAELMSVAAERDHLAKVVNQQAAQINKQQLRADSAESHREKLAEALEAIRDYRFMTLNTTKGREQSHEQAVAALRQIAADALSPTEESEE